MREEFSGREDSLAGFVWHRLMIQWNLLMIRLKIVLKLGEKNLNRLLLILSRSKRLKPICIKFTSNQAKVIADNADYPNYLTSAGYTYNQFAQNIYGTLRQVILHILGDLLDYCCRPSYTMQTS